MAEVAEAEVREGVAFREAHEAVGRLVGHCAREGLDLRELSQDDLGDFHPAFPASGAELLDLEGSVEARAQTGGTSRARVEDEIDLVADELARETQALEGEGA